MDENYYKVREVDEKFEAVHGRFDDMGEKIDEKFTSMYAKQDKTNGRVAWLEKMVWLAFGGIGVLGVQGVVTLISSLFK